MGCVGVWSDLSFFHSDFIFKLLNSSNHRDLKWISRARWYSIGILLVGPFSFFDSTNNPKFFLWTHGFNIDRGNTRPCHVSPFFRWIKTGPRHTRGTWVWPYEKLGSKTKEQNPFVGLSVQSKIYGPTIWTIHLRIPPCTHNSTRWLFFFPKQKCSSFTQGSGFSAVQLQWSRSWCGLQRSRYSSMSVVHLGN